MRWRVLQFISKTSNFLIPIIGWSMYLTGHVPLKRMDRRSQMVRGVEVVLCATRDSRMCVRAGVPEQVPRAAAPEHAGAVFPRGEMDTRIVHMCVTLTLLRRSGHALRHGQDGGVQEGRVHRGCQGGRRRGAHHAGRHRPADAQRCGSAEVRCCAAMWLTDSARQGARGSCSRAR